MENCFSRTLQSLYRHNHLVQTQCTPTEGVLFLGGMVFFTPLTDSYANISFKFKPNLRCDFKSIQLYYSKSLCGHSYSSVRGPSLIQLMSLGKLNRKEYVCSGIKYPQRELYLCSCIISKTFPCRQELSSVLYLLLSGMSHQALLFGIELILLMREREGLHLEEADIFVFQNTGQQFFMSWQSQKILDPPALNRDWCKGLFSIKSIFE